MRDEAPIVPASGWAAWATTLAAGAMSVLAVLALAAGLAAGRLAEEWQGALAGTATVRLSGEPDTMEFRAAQAMEVLRQTPGIAGARLLGAEEQAALLAPWFGDGAALDGLPVPQLIDLRLEGAGPDAAALQSRLDLASEGAVYDDHAAWRAPLEQAARSLAGLAWAAMALVALAAGAMVALAARASLASHLDVVRVLRIIGADDRYIASAFTRRLSARAAIGATAGTAAALLSLALLPEIGIDRALKPALLPGPAGWAAILVGVPAVAALIAWATARRAVSRQLARMP